MSKILKIAGLLFTAIAFLLGLLLITTDTIPESLIAPIQNTFPSVGSIHTLQGHVMTRTAGDILWLPSKEEELVRVYNRYFTNKEAELEIQLDKKNSFNGALVRIVGFALIQIYEFKDTPVIKLNYGQIEILSDSDTSLYVDNGFKRQLVNTNGENFLVENLKSGLQVNKVEEEKTPEQPKEEKNVAESPEEELSDDEGKNSKTDNKESEESIQEVATSFKDLPNFEIPYPPENSVVFYQTEKDLPIVPSNRCASKECHLTVTYNQAVLCKKDFTEKEPTVCHIRLKDIAGKVTVTFVSAEEIQYLFTLMPMSMENIANELDKEETTDVLILE